VKRFGTALSGRKPGARRPSDFRPLSFRAEKTTFHAKAVPEAAFHGMIITLNLTREKPGNPVKEGRQMSEFWTLLFRFSFGLLCHSLILYLMTDSKYSRAVTLGAWLGTFVFTTLAIVPLILFIHNVNLLFVIEAFSSLTIYCTMYLCLSRGPVWRNLFISLTYATFFLFALSLSSCLSQIFFEGSHWATVAGRTFFLGLYALWLVRNPSFGPQFLSAHMEKGWGTLASFSVFCGITVYITVLAFLIFKVDVGVRMAVSAILFLLIGSAYLLAGRTIGLINQGHEARELEAQRKLLENQLATEREFVTRAKTQRHDMYHHIYLITDYLERGDIEGAKTYLSQYRAELDADTLEVYCENAAANALFRHTARRCSGSAVPFTCHTAIPQTLSLTSPELVTVLGNVLENAWEACRQSETPWISVTARCRGIALLVEVRNAVSGKTSFEDDLPVSTKPGGGLGLKSASRVLKKHGGIIYCFRTGDTFFTQVMIPLER